MKKIFATVALLATLAPLTAFAGVKYTSVPHTTTPRQSLVITSIQNGQVFTRGSSVKINWLSQNVDVATVNLRKNGVHYRTLIVERQNAQAFFWNVPTDIPAGSDYSIRVVSGNELVSDVRNITIR